MGSLKKLSFNVRTGKLEEIEVPLDPAKAEKGKKISKDYGLTKDVLPSIVKRGTSDNEEAKLDIVLDQPS